MARNALGIVTRMGHDLGHGGKAIEPGPEGKRLALKALTATKTTSTTAKIIATKTIAKRSDTGKILIYGYARVSTTEQETTLQINALKFAKAKAIFQEKTSSVGARPELRKLIAQLTTDDTVIVYKLDRLARSLKDLLQILEQIEHTGAKFKSLTEPIDTVTPAGKLMLNILGSFAEFERSLIRERTMAGQLAARQAGVHCGRPRVLPPDDEKAVLRLWASGVYTLDALALVFDCHASVIKRTIYRVHKPTSSSLL